MNRFGKAAPWLGLILGVALLGYSQYSEAPADGDPLIQWQEKVASRIERIDGELVKASTAPIQEHVIDLPEDGNQWQTVVVYATPDATDVPSKRLAAALKSDARLSRLAEQTQFKQFDTSHWWVQNNLQGRGYRFPCIYLARPIGGGQFQTVYRAQGDGIPWNGSTLASEIQLAIEGCSDCRPRPTPTPQPVTPNQPLPDVRPNLGPDSLDAPTEDDMGLLAYALIAVSGLGGAYYAYKKESGV